MDMTPEVLISLALKEIKIKQATLISVADRYNTPKTSLHRYLKKIEHDGDIDSF